MRRPLVAILFAALVALPAYAIAQVPQVGHVPLSPGVPGPNQLVAPNDEVVEIVRDAYGVPHIYADSPYALGFGNGYAQAQDRLFQLDILRHVAKGDSASMLGPAQLASDLEIRRELYTDAERQEAADALPAFERALFDGFAAGVNRFIAEAHASPLRMPSEFAAVGHPVEPWAVTDTIAIAQFLLDYFGAGGGQELTNAMILAQLRDQIEDDAEARKAFDDMIWIRHTLAEPAIPAEEGVYPSFPATTDWDAVPAEQREAALAAVDAEPFGDGESITSVVQEQYKFKFGSNAVIVAPGKSKSGGGLLGGGPQMGYYSPMVPYEVGLHGAGFDITGIGVGGAPGVVIGRTDGFSWTVTSGIGDQVDVVGVKLVPGERTRYYLDGEEVDMECRTEVHVVKDPLPTSGGALLAFAENVDVLTQEACRTVYGPVFAINEDAGWAFSRERSHRHEEIPSGVRWLTIGTKTDLAGFRDTLSDFAFTFNFHYVDSENLYYQHVGYQPVRDARLDPRLPRPGSTSDYGWKGVLTGDDLPHTLNPDRGWIVNWNNVPQKGWTGSGDQRELWGSVHRVDLLKQRMDAAFSKNHANGGKVDIDDVAEAVKEAATRDPFARRTVPHILEADLSVAWNVSRTPEMEEAKALLTQWKHADYVWEADANGTYHPAHAIYDRWREHVQEFVFEDELGDFMRPISFDPPNSDDPHGGDHAQHTTKDALLIDAFEGHTEHAWCWHYSAFGNGVHTTEPCDAPIVFALELALIELASEFGTWDMSQWRMPQHEIRFIAMNAGPAFTMPMMNRASFNHLHDWGVQDNRNAQSVLPPGAGAGYYPPLLLVDYLANGNLPPHARDQLDLYIAWEYKPFNFYRDQAEEGGNVIELHTQVPNTAATPPPVPS